MLRRSTTKLNPKKRYLQVALNGSLEDAYEIISNLPISDRIIVEAGTPLIKRYGEYGIRQIYNWYKAHLSGQLLTVSRANDISEDLSISMLFKAFYDVWKTQKTSTKKPKEDNLFPYIVADLKTMDRGETEVEIAARGGASAAVALGTSPIETLNSFIEKCESNSLIAASDEDLVKIHFHTNEPWKILEYCNSVGEVFDIVVEDMIRQANGQQG